LCVLALVSMSLYVPSLHSRACPLCFLEGCQLLQPFSNFWFPPGSPPSKDSLSASRYALVDINITHPIRVTQMAISHFLKQKKPGVITHITSVAGQVPFFPTPVYVASKHAISGFVRSLANLENPPAPLPKIRVNAVAPARILTPLWTDNPEKMKMVDLNRPGWVTPEDVAKVMIDLVEKEENVGGTVMEVGASVRKVEAFNDPGPKAGGNSVDSVENVGEDAWESMLEIYNGK
jgi:3-hydroxybutyrate dehydrogenase